MKRKILAAAVAASMIVALPTAVAPVEATNGYQSITPISAEINPIYAELDEIPQFPWYGSFSGTVTEINPWGREEGTFPKQVVLENAEGRTAWLNISEDTFHLTDNAIEIGSKVTGFFEKSAPMILIYPPQYGVRAIAVDLPENQFVAAARFDENFISDCGRYMLNITEETNIILQDGTRFFDSEYGTLEALHGRKMVFVYDVSTRSIPALINPLKVVVMFEIAVHLPGFGFDTGFDYGYGNYDLGFIGIEPPIHFFTEEERAEWLAIFGAEVAASEIVVNGGAIEAPALFLDEDGVVMIPLRAIAEALGYDVIWSGVTESIWLSNVASLRIGEDAYTFARLPVIQLGTAPVLTAEGLTFVPKSFFTQVMNYDAFIMDGQMVISRPVWDTQMPYCIDCDYDNGNGGSEIVTIF